MATDVFDILVSKAGISEELRQDFVHKYMTGVMEFYVFDGKFGDGCKFRRRESCIEMKKENETPELWEELRETHKLWTKFRHNYP